MARIFSIQKGHETTDVMNYLASYLLSSGLAVCEDGCGFQEASYALHDFEVHVVKKNKVWSK